jgi:hypothetical protein
VIEKLKLRRLANEDDANSFLSLIHDEDISQHLLLSSRDDDAIIALLRDVRNIALLCEDERGATHAAIFFHWQEMGIYEVHTMARRAVRGRTYIACVYEALRCLFLMDTCMELWTRVPSTNKAALGLVRLVKGRKMFSSLGCDFYQLRWDDWLWGKGKASGEGLIAYGKWFHARLEQQYADQARKHASHEDSEDHDRMVGAACELILNGMVEKGVILYNRWAKFAGYAQVGIVIANPLVVNIGDALLQVDFGQREFLLLDVKPEDIILPRAQEAGTQHAVAQEN